MEVNKLDAFTDLTGLSKEYDFNKDGTVTIEDYRIALIQLNDDDPDNDVKFSKAQLDDIFADVIEAAKATEAPSNITEENALDVGNQLVSNAKSTISDPSLAKDFAELQTIGAKLSQFIRQCSEVLPLINAQLEALEAELVEIEEEKEAKEKEYAKVEDKVNQKSDDLAFKMNDVLSRSESVSHDMENNTNSVIDKCIEDYKKGEYPGQDLYSVITQKLGENAGESSAVSELRSAINACGNLGSEIKSLCTEIEGIVGDIRTITQKYNDKTNNINAIKDTRNGVLDASSEASVEYQKGYQRRADLRQEVIDKYFVPGNGTDDMSNPQIGKIEEFLNNNEMANLPFADAYAILQGIAGNCGINFSNGNIHMPNYIWIESESEITDSQRSAMDVFNKLSAAINNQYGNAGGKANNNGVKTGDGTEGLTNPLDDTTTINTLAGATGDTAAGDADDADDEGDSEEEYLTSGEPCSLGTCTQSTCCDPITFQNDGKTFHFISDNDKDGIFDDESEFLGANKGWDEMVAYDKNNDGKITGDELNDLKLVASDDSNGQFTFMSAAEVGIAEIDLSTFVDKEEKLVNGDVLQGTFDIKMQDGTTVNARQTDDDAKNIEMNYSNLFGAEIKDLTETYEDNPFMEEFVETLSTSQTVSETSSGLSSLDSRVNNTIENQNSDSDGKVSSSSSSAEKLKAKEDAELEEKEKLLEDE